jgi:UDP-N-acetylglucosamine diphosphorylase/glucosamine-1-phosphate N-acetyltransferase
MSRSYRMIIFDDGLGQLGPMTDLRASFEVRTGMLTTAGRIRALRPKMLAGYWVPEHLRALVAARADAPVNAMPNEEALVCVNGRWALPDPKLELGLEHALVEEATGHVICACLRRANAEYFLMTGQLHERVQVKRHSQRVLYKYPWDVMGLVQETIPRDIESVRLLDTRVPGPDCTTTGPHPVELHATATIGPNVVFDSAAGPIVVHERAVIRPGAVLCGPCSIGPGSTIVDRAHIKANTVIGPTCKVGGEVGGTIFQGYANKGHDGHLGDSWVGKWANFGAGTTNSNLLNTYGEVTMRIEAEGPRHRTGLTFLGAIVGDHVKTAIATRIMTGTVLGTGAMLAATMPPPSVVRRFAWVTDDGERLYRLGKFLEVMRTVMSRRQVTVGPEYVAAVEALHRQWTE